MSQPTFGIPKPTCISEWQVGVMSSEAQVGGGMFSAMMGVRGLFGDASPNHVGEWVPRYEFG